MNLKRHGFCIVQQIMNRFTVNNRRVSPDNHLVFRQPTRHGFSESLMVHCAHDGPYCCPDLGRSAAVPIGRVVYRRCRVLAPRVSVAAAQWVRPRSGARPDAGYNETQIRPLIGTR